jgi:hypothetical protein
MAVLIPKEVAFLHPEIDRKTVGITRIPSTLWRPTALPVVFRLHWHLGFAVDVGFGRYFAVSSLYGLLLARVNCRACTLFSRFGDAQWGNTFDNFVMAPEQSTHTWLGAFAARLLQLRPGFDASSAIRCAVENIHDLTELDPRCAAEQFAHANAWTLTAAQEPEAPQAGEPQSSRYRRLFSPDA